MLMMMMTRMNKIKKIRIRLITHGAIFIVMLLVDEEAVACLGSDIDQDLD